MPEEPETNSNDDSTPDAPSPPPAEEKLSSPTPTGGEDFKAKALRYWNLFSKEVKLAIGRTVKSDFTKVAALPDEREKLETVSTPVRDELTQNYSAWRRSVLLLAAGVLIIHGLLLMVTYQDAEEMMREQSRATLEANITQQGGQVPGVDEFGNFRMVDQRMSQAEIDKAVDAQLDQTMKLYGEDNLGVFDMINIVLTISTIAGAVLVMLAARKWTDVSRSVDLARYGFLAMFLTPILLNLVPVSGFLDFSHLKSGQFAAGTGMDPEQQIQLMETTFGTMIAVSLLLFTAPKIIAVFAGAIRSAITIKTLIPESSTPGIAVTTLGPLYAMFLIVAFGTANQFQNDFALLGGTLCLLIVPIVYLVHATAFLKPQDQESVAVTVSNARRAALIFNLVGFSLVGVFVLELEFMGLKDLVQLLTLFLGNLLVLSVVGSDFMLYSIHRDYRQTRDVTGTGLIESLEGKIEKFEELGLTRLRRSAGKKK